MGAYGGFYKGDRRKPKKRDLEKKAQKVVSHGSFILPSVEIIKKGKNEK